MVLSLPLILYKTTLTFSADGLKIVPVNSYADIEAKTEEGTRNRTVASTNMNATSRYDCIQAD